MKLFFTTLIAALLLGACTRPLLTPHEYISWVEDADNGLNVEKEIDGHVFMLQYKPVSYEVLLQSRDAQLSETDFTTLKAQLEGLQYFRLTILPADHKELAISGNANEDEYSNRITYMMSEMQYDFELIDGSDTLACVFLHAERNFNLSPENHILLGFEKPTRAQEEDPADKTLIYTDRILGCGPVMITVKANDLENIPELKFAE